MQENKIFIIRLISAFIIGGGFIFSLLLSTSLFIFVYAVVTYFMLSEWYKITSPNKLDLAVGVTLISTASSIIMTLANLNSKMVLIYFIIIWATDTIAMFSGKTLRGPKLAPSVSPNKTWSGAIGGTLGAYLVVYLLNISILPLKNISPIFSEVNLFVFTLVISVSAQISDLLESFYKRKYNIKDSGNIIPGHGGMLDRFDSTLLSASVYLAIIWFYSNKL